jgi:general L-amino acid transport system permease protein
MADISFVRNDMLPAQEPPVSQRGVVKWLRENLFSGWINSALTVLGLLAVFFLVRAILPWLLHGVTNANSQLECYSTVVANWGEDATGACWAIIKQRWNQFIFGFYPQDLYWRPILAGGLLVSALAPVLYFGQRRINMILVGVAGLLTLLCCYAVGGFALTVPTRTEGIGGDNALSLLIPAAVFAVLFAVAALRPRMLLWFTLLFPFAGFYLLWGGSVWRPLLALSGFVILAGVFIALRRRLGVVVAMGAGALVAAVWWIWGTAPVQTAMDSTIGWGLAAVASHQFGGFLLTFVIGITAISCSLPMGILLALGRRSDMPLIKGLSVGFIEFIRGVPLITLLFTASLLLQYFLPPQTNFDLILRVIILVTFFSAAYIAEVIRGGLAALPRGQYEAADALGLDYWQAQRLIIMPQALKIAIPGIVSSFIGLFKDTTLVALVGLADPLVGVTRVVRSDIAWKGIYWEPLIFVGVIFFIVCFSMSRYSMYLERKLKTDHR